MWCWGWGGQRQSWGEVCELRNRSGAILYFRDHIEENLFRTADGHLHESLAAAQEHRRRSFAEHRRDHAAARVINGVRLGPEGAETWEVVDPANAALAGYDAFVWHDSTTGLNHRTESLDEAVAYDAEQAKVLEQIDAAEAAVRIERRIIDQSRQLSVWVGVEE